MRGCVKSGYACRIAFETGENPKLSEAIQLHENSRACFFEVVY